ncbi:uncharacterized protein K452DRAFT_291555 [Aplosporella prunicola CBS 121167]|uniref:Methyltransferase type 11 domain-containing protein n=1 Tax=Aplosporella prunicola CBS 121167 TaxID=1176127 RepID=A0A6A6B1P2_9PEZI|nr:uncharacterized protein K452DRAFT_291555 [Aplosporella prunicola CBS 121167]KAF2137508.1 hypothetical protein K452DRAFT_291555 [Aplosporella prunicola CBS 121167]
MTQPSLNTTFDTSVIDLSQPETVQFTGSFSTTDTDPSEFGAPTEVVEDTAKPSIPSSSDETPKPSQDTPRPSTAVTSSVPKPVRHMDTTAAYDAWAPVYDTDGNILQKVDDIELEKTLPVFLDMVKATAEESPKDAYKIVDLGCGTGRNTRKLLQHKWKLPRGATIDIVGVDASPGMLARADEKLLPIEEEISEGAEPAPVRLSLFQHDILYPTDLSSSPDPLPTRADALISTLVLEHVPLSVFFAALSRILLPRGVALITNMHPEMGAKSQAGFVMADAEGKRVKVRGKSYVHTVEETVKAAQEVGFELVGEVMEREVEDKMLEEGLLGERGWKWVDCKVWYGVILRKK